MNERLKLLRNTLNMTQSAFGKKIGRSLISIQQYEAGTRKLDESMLLLIERTFNLNPLWLRTGEGEIFMENSKIPQTDGLTESMAYYIERLSPEDKEKAFKYIQNLQQIAEAEKEVKNKKEQAG